MSRPAWSGERWIGGVVVAGGLAIMALSFGLEGSVRTLVIGAALLTGGIVTLVRASHQAIAPRCIQCTNLFSAQDTWTRCVDCNGELHYDCAEMHAEAYHSRRRPPGKGPYRGSD
jgi:hypothetical protein